MSAQLTAAVIGASGIGKHHAKWLDRLGCAVTGFAGTSPQSVAATQAQLKELFGFAGTGYPSVAEMLQAGRYDIVSVCSPEELHYEHFLAALEHGAHVMCEKPLVYDADLTSDQMLSQAQEMVEAAEELARVAAVNTQYAAAVDAYHDFMAARGIEPGVPRTFFMQMESRGGGPEGTNFEQIWVDLASHPLSVLMAFCGPGAMDEASASCTVEQKVVEAEFDYVMEGGGSCRAHIVCRNRPEGALVRRFGINDLLVDYEGRNDDEGIYRAWLSREGEETCAQDFMEASIERFVDAVRGDVPRPLATAAEGLQNLEMQLHLLDMSQRI
ncbi:MAG: Gfo/Idh/MocA family protein [Armatimonadota bacterium]